MDTKGGEAEDIEWGDMRQVQAEITRWAENRFPGRTDFAALSKLVLHEIPELLTHKKEHGTQGIGPELADCFILLFDLASMWNVDMIHAIATKMEINYERQWTRDENGIMQHIPEEQ